MPQAKISVNAVVGSNTDLPINQVVQLDNVNIGGELTYNWTILDQPPGTTDVLSSAVVQSPTFTPKKEGTYYIKLVVNLGLATEQEDRVVVGIRQVKTRERIPAAGETTESDASDGWATAMNSLLRRIDQLLSDPATMVGKNNSGGVLTKGQIVRCTSLPTIKTGLPGQEVVPGFVVSLATTLGQVDELLAIVEGAPDGSVSVSDQGIIKVRHFGVPRNADGTAQTFTGTPAVGDPVYLSDTGTIALVSGTIRRQLGSVASVGGGFYSIMFNGVGGADITPIDRRYVVHGAPGTLTDAVRVDGTNATALTTPFRIKAGDAATVALQVQGFLAGTDLQQWLSSTATVVARITNAGQLTLDAEGISIPTAGKHITFGNFSQKLVWPSAVQLYGISNGITMEVGDPTDFLAISRSAATHTQASLQSTNGSFQAIWRVFNTTSNVIFGTVGSGHLDFYTNFVARWRVTSSGELVAQGGNRAIQSVLDPVNPQDAATKAYVDQAILPNMVINGNMQFWQRWDAGTTEADASFDANTALADRVFTADRWWPILSHSNGSALGTDVFSLSKQTVTGEQDFDFCIRCRIKTKTNTWSSAHSLWMVQEIDRGFVQRARGKKVSLTVRWRKGSTMADDGHIKIITQTGDPRKIFNGNPSVTWAFNNTQFSNGPTATPGSHPAFDVAGYTGSVTILDDTTANASIGTAFTTKTAVASAIVPTDATGMVLLIGRKLASAVADANEYLEHSRVRLVIGEVAPVDFQYAGGSEHADIELCQRYFEKSNDIMASGLAPSTPSGSFTASIGTGGVLPTVPYKVEKVLFWLGAGGAASTTRRIAIWPTDGTPQGSITNVSGVTEPTVSVVNDNNWGYHLERTGGGAVTTDDHCRWHWAADYEI